MTGDDTIRCYFCGNEYTLDCPLVWGDTGAGRAPIHGDDDCPPLPEGWDACLECLRAAPTAELVLVHPIVVYPDGTSAESPRTRDSFVCRGECAARRPWAMQLPDGTQHRVPHPVVSHRHPIAAPPKAPRRDEDIDADTADRGRADAVPADGPGLTIKELAGVWGVSERTAQRVMTRLLDADLARFEEVATKAGGAPRKVYWRVDR